MCKKFSPSLFPLLIIVGFSALLLWAQIATQATIVGSDAIFHYNRFYDTAMQLKTGEFDYFISTFGYQQSGRIVNALYGPFFAYLQGGLLLISGTWFKYQLLSRLLLSLIAGSGMYRLLRQAKVEQWLSLVLALFFLTTFAVQYWSIRQGFSSWGVTFFPWCLLPAIAAIQTKQVKPLTLAVAVALMLQIHTLSTLLLVLTFIPFFAHAFLTSPRKWFFLKQMMIAIGLCLLLMANVWLPLIILGQANELIQPFINKRLPESTIDRSSIVLFFQPVGLAYLLMAQLPLTVLAIKKKASPLYHLSLLAFLIMFGLSSSLFPWDSLSGKNIKLVELIQFPFRFFLIATPLFLLVFGQGLTILNRWKKTIIGFIACLTLAGAYQNIQEEYDIIASQYETDTPIQLRKHTKLLGSADEVRQSLHSADLERFLTLAVKSTPDYLPLYHQTKENRYKLYEKLVIDQHHLVEKTKQNGQLLLSWTSDAEKTIHLPVIIYSGTQTKLNGQALHLTPEQLSPIGTPTVMSQVGENNLVLTYQPNSSLYPAIWGSLIGWFGLVCSAILMKMKNKPQTKTFF
ncbi:hypothetical protein ACERC8_02905 [Streptococcus sp. E29BA]|uniref:hypothetical protein n=1 Tax=Streptococcus sp. E29BA TaxID=3278716 RepID=UPI00359CC0B8